MTVPPAQNYYYDEVVTIELDRLTLLAIVSATLLALKHPEMPQSTRAILNHTLRALIPQVTRYAPPSTLEEWAEILETP